MDAPKKTYGTVLWIIAILLTLVLATNVFSIVTTYQQSAVARERAETYKARVEEVQDLVNRQRDIILNLVSDYETAAYDDPRIERITEQQLLAAEFQLLAMQTLAIQNSQIIELLSASP